MQPLHDLNDVRAYPPTFRTGDATAAIASSLRRDPTDTSHQVRNRLAALDAGDRPAAMGDAARELGPTGRDELGASLSDRTVVATAPKSANVADTVATGDAPVGAVSQGRQPADAGASETAPGVAAPQPLETVSTAPAPGGPGAQTVESEPGGDIAAVTPSEDVGGDETGLPHLSDLLEEAGPSPTTRFETSAPAGPVDVSALVDELARGTSAAEAVVRDQARQACRRLDRQVGAARHGVRAEVTRADAMVGQIIAKRRGELDRTLSITDANIDVQKRIRREEARDHGKTVKSNLAAVFQTHRDAIEEKHRAALDQVDHARNAETNFLHTHIDENAQQAFMTGFNFYKRQPNTERGFAVGNAVYAIGSEASRQFKESEQDSIQGVNEVTGQMADEVNKTAGQALEEFDKAPPLALVSVDLQVVPAALGDIEAKAQQAHRVLAKPTEAMRGRLDALDTEARARNAAGGAEIEAELERGRAQAVRQLLDVVPAVVEPVRQLNVEAATILTSADSLDPTRSRQFVDEMLTFTRGATEESAAVFDEACTSASTALEPVRLVARRGFRRVQRQLSATIKAEGGAIDGALLAFELALDEQYGRAVTDIDDAGLDACLELPLRLEPVVRRFGTGLIKSVNRAWWDLRQRILEGLREQVEAKRALPGKMREAAIQAAWEYDHPILSRVVTVLGFVLGLIVAIVAIVFGFEIIVGLLMLAGLSEAVATVVTAVAGIALLVYSAYSSYTARREAGQGVGAALLGTLADLTGITQLRHSLTDSNMSPFERGLEFGFGLGTLLSPLLSRARIVRRISGRLKPRIIDPRGGAPAVEAQALAAEAVAVRPAGGGEQPVRIETPAAVEPSAPSALPRIETTPTAEIGEPLLPAAEQPAPVTSAERAQTLRDADAAGELARSARHDLESRPAPQPEADVPERAPRTEDGPANVEQQTTAKVEGSKEPGTEEAPVIPIERARARRQALAVAEPPAIESPRAGEPAAEGRPAEEAQSRAEEPLNDIQRARAKAEQRAADIARRAAEAQKARMERPAQVRQVGNGPAIVESGPPGEASADPISGQSQGPATVASRSGPRGSTPGAPGSGRVQPAGGGAAGSGGQRTPAAAPRTNVPAQRPAPSGVGPQRIRRPLNVRGQRRGRPRGGRPRRPPPRPRLVMPGRLTNAEFRANMRVNPHGYVYRIVDQFRNILKWGTAVNPFSRISGYEREGVQFFAMEVMEEAPRAQQLAAESFEAGEVELSGAEGLNIRMNTLTEMKGGGEWSDEVFIPDDLLYAKPLITIRSRASE